MKYRSHQRIPNLRILGLASDPDEACFLLADILASDSFTPKSRSNFALFRANLGAAFYIHTNLAAAMAERDRVFEDIRVKRPKTHRTICPAENQEPSFGTDHAKIRDLAQL